MEASGILIIITITTLVIGGLYLFNHYYKKYKERKHENEKTILLNK